ncbi:hypothetical protein BH23CHL5_BH23CHL5_08110 [soil metagenome]
MDHVLKISEACRTTHQGVVAGVLVATNLVNPDQHHALTERLDATELSIRETYADLSRAEIRERGVLAKYADYYKRFGQNYHVQHQIESISKKNRRIPRASALVAATFAAELANGLLTAVHDLAGIELPVTLDTSDGNPAYEQYSGETINVKESDLFYRDGNTVLSSIVSGPSTAGRLTSDTTAVLVTVYGVAGVTPAEVRHHLDGIWDLFQLFSADGNLEALVVEHV